MCDIQSGKPTQLPIQIRSQSTRLRRDDAGKLLILVVRPR